MQTRKWGIKVAILCLCLGVASTCPAKVIHVDVDAPGANDGSSWENAYSYLQDALMFATAGDEIRVAQGVYRPDEFVLSKRPNLGREETFQLKNGVNLKGGYAGFGQTAPNARDVALYKTILSGDLNGDDVEVADACDLRNEPSRVENSYHVVVASGTDSSAVLDGFVVTGGNSGGMHCGYYSATVSDCIFTKNSAVIGGGMFIGDEATVINCRFSQNWADWTGGGISNGGRPVLIDCIISGNSAGHGGGGMESFDTEGSARLTGCVFERNSAEYGGGMFNDESTPTLIYCMFVENSARNSGGAICNWSWANLEIINCTFVANVAGEYGGAIGDPINCGLTTSVTNCTFVGNLAEKGSALYEGCDHIDHPSGIMLSNSILWDGGHQIWAEKATTITLDYCNVLGGRIGIHDPCNVVVWGKGNIDIDPCFAGPGYWDPNGTPEDANDDFWVDGDYHLKSQAGRWHADEGRWTIDEETSPCIDAGDPMSPIGSEPFPNGGVINMGAYGGTGEASKSYFGEPPCEIVVAGDINGDCEVNFLDFRFLALHWLEEH